MSEIRTDHDRTASVIFADFDERLAAGRFQKNQLRAAVTFLATDLLESENLAVEVESFFKIGNTVTSVKKFGDHGSRIDALKRRSQDDNFGDFSSEHSVIFSKIRFRLQGTRVGFH